MSGDTDSANAASDPMFRWLLALLVDGPSSLAALWRGLIVSCGYPPTLDPGRLQDSLAAMEEPGWVRSSLMTETGEWRSVRDADRARVRALYRAWLTIERDVSYDPVGLWYAIEPQGRAECWRQWGAPADEQRWTVDDRPPLQTVTVRAATAEAARAALAQWLVTAPHVSALAGAERLRRVQSFSLRDGTEITGGVELVQRYQAHKSTSGAGR